MNPRTKNMRIELNCGWPVFVYEYTGKTYYINLPKVKIQ